ncbi:PKD domain-containing protein, partial [Candidatus Bathyarchaeota archaeon]|nr:PKD domain-containing protein [Candidatus Bathyarchaeota archaeon]
ADPGFDQTVEEDKLVTFDGSKSTDNVGIINYTWTFIDVTPQTLISKNPTYIFQTPGIYTITLNVTDAAGNSGIRQVTITVLDITSPRAEAGSDREVEKNTLVMFDASQSSDNVGILSYVWTFTDGTPQILYGPKPTYVFKSPGTYTITLNVTDAAGNSHTDAMSITVLDIPVWRELWFWLILASTATVIPTVLFGIKYYRNFQKEREAHHREEEFIRDVTRREKKKKEIEEKYKLPPIRDSPTMQNLLEKLGLKKER